MLDQLIHEGENLSKENTSEDIYCDEFEIWLNKCISYIEMYHCHSAITKKFLAEYENGTEKSANYFKRMLNIIKAFKEVETYESRGETIINKSNW